jgi:transcriptional regulator with XRE-family HTH domain
MKVDEYPPCDLWDLQKPPIPSRSRLYHLEPIGIGTPYVESLTGYVARLAEAHCLTTSVLIRDQVAPLIEQEYMFNRKKPNLNRLRERSQHLNGTKLKAAALVEALETLTLYPGLRCLTMLSWNEVISQKGLLRNVQGWCPNCYEEWRQAGKVIYEPLIWTFNVVTVCSHHYQYLQLYCPHCYKQLSILATYSRPGYCSKCGEWLGISTGVQASDSKILLLDELKWQLWVIDNLGELIAMAPYISSSLPKQTIAKAISSYTNNANVGSTDTFLHLIGASKGLLNSWRKNKTIPQIYTVLKICFCLGISLTELLTQNFFTLDTDVIKLEAQDKLIKKLTYPMDIISSKKNYKKTNIEEIQSTLVSILEMNEYPPPSMNEVARRVGIPAMTLRSSCLDLCHEISARYLCYCKASKQEREEKLRNQIRQAVFELHGKGITPHHKNVEKLLPKPGIMREKEAVTAFREARRELGYGK